MADDLYLVESSNKYLYEMGNARTLTFSGNGLGGTTKILQPVTVATSAKNKYEKRKGTGGVRTAINAAGAGLNSFIKNMEPIPFSHKVQTSGASVGIIAAVVLLAAAIYLKKIKL